MHPQDTTDPTTARIPLRSHNGAVRAYVTIDAADLPLIAEYPWHLDGCGYAATNIRVDGKWHTAKMHRLLLGLTRGDRQEADHINRDRLDNRRANLRVLPKAGRPNTHNCANYRGSRSQYRGVSWENGAGRKHWTATVNINGKQKRIGRFHTEEEAAAAAREARARYLPYSTD